MSKTLHQNLYLRVSKNTGRPVRQSLIECLVHNRLEGFHDYLDAEIVVAIEYLSAIYLVHLQPPLADVYDLISEG